MNETIRALPTWAQDWPTAYAVIQAIVILLVVVLMAALMSFIERRLLAVWQDRYGPNRVGPGGMFQIVADMLKIMFKEDWTPKFADKLTFRLAPAVAMATAVLSFMVIPVSPTMGVADMNIGLLFFMAMAGVAVTHRHPFDQPEAEQELAEGYHVEYGGMKWGMFFVAEYVNIILISALIVTLFFGGWLAPFNLEISFIPPAFWFIAKTAFFVMMFVLARGSLMRPRYDQVMNFGWKVCLPLALINLLVTGAVILLNQAA